MKKLFIKAKTSIKNAFAPAVTAAAAIVAISAASASVSEAAAILDFSTVTPVVTAELGPAVTSAMPIVGILMAVTIGYKVYKRMTK